LKSLGKIFNLTSTGLLIAKTESTPRIGSNVIDNRKKIIGVVKNIIGPVDAPYVVIIPNRKDAKTSLKLIGTEIYTK